MQSDPIDRALALLPIRRTFRDSHREIEVAFLLRTADWRPLKANWWHGKEVCIIGADLNGNFFLCHCDGSVRYWDHDTRDDAILAPSVKEFVARLSE